VHDPRLAIFVAVVGRSLFGDRADEPEAEGAPIGRSGSEPTERFGDAVDYDLAFLEECGTPLAEIRQ
jgi:hypothetical protein